MRSPRRWVRAATALVAAGCLVVLAGCGGLSTDSTVQPGLRVDAVERPAVQYVPPPPEHDGNPESIIRGFIRAGSASDGDYEVGRTFLAAEAGSTWTPDGDVVVFGTQSPTTVDGLSGSKWRFHAPVVAVIHADGRYEPLPPGTTMDAVFTVDKVAGQWRISLLPKGFARWVSVQDIDRLFSAYRLTYLSATDQSLVPDVRWFPQDHLATRLARAQIEPVPAYLTGAVQTFIPAQAQLRVQSVPVSAGIATVDLSGLQVTADARVRRLIWTQLTQTLTQLSDVSQVMVQSDGAPLDYPGRPERPLAPEDLNAPTDPSPVELPVIRNDTHVIQVDPVSLLGGSQGDTSVRPTKRHTYVDVDRGWAWLALSADATEVAAVNGNQRGLARFRGGNRYDIPVGAKTLIGRPTYDGAKFLWFGALGQSPTGPGRLWAVNTGGDPASVNPVPAPVAAPWLADRVVLSCRISADGQRIAVVSTDARGGDPRLDVAGVVRGAEGRPESLASPLRLAPVLTLVRDVAWLDDGSLAVLGRVAANEPVRPYVVGLDGDPRALSAIAGAQPESLATTAGERDLVVTTDRDEIYIRAGARWRALTKGTDFAVPAG